MSIFNFFKKNNDRGKIEVLKKKDLKRQDEEISYMKKLNKRVNLITEKGDIEIIIRNVDGIIRELR